MFRWILKLLNAICRQTTQITQMLNAEIPSSSIRLGVEKNWLKYFRNFTVYHLLQCFLVTRVGTISTKLPVSRTTLSPFKMSLRDIFPFFFSSLSFFFLLFLVFSKINKNVVSAFDRDFKKKRISHEVLQYVPWRGAPRVQTGIVFYLEIFTAKLFTLLFCSAPNLKRIVTR